MWAPRIKKTFRQSTLTVVIHIIYITLSLSVPVSKNRNITLSRTFKLSYTYIFNHGMKYNILNAHYVNYHITAFKSTFSANVSQGFNLQVSCNTFTSCTLVWSGILFFFKDCLLSKMAKSQEQLMTVCKRNERAQARCWYMARSKMGMLHHVFIPGHAPQKQSKWILILHTCNLQPQ